MNIASNFSYFIQNMPYYILYFAYIFSSALGIFFKLEHRKLIHFL